MAAKDVFEQEAEDYLIEMFKTGKMTKLEQFDVTYLAQKLLLQYNNGLGDGKRKAEPEVRQAPVALEQPS